MRTRIGLVFLLPACAFAQNQNAIGITSTNNTAGQLGGTMTIGAAPFIEPAVTGAPYSAEETKSACRR